MKVAINFLLSVAEFSCLIFFARNQRIGMDLYYSDANSGSRAIRMLATTLGVELNLVPINIFKHQHLTPEFLKVNYDYNENQNIL